MPYRVRRDQRTRTAEDGSYRIDQVEPGRWGIWATPRLELSGSLASVTAEAACCRDVMRSGVEVAPGQETKSINLTLRAGVSIAGTVADKRTVRAVRGAQISAGRQVDGKAWSVETTADNKGRFCMDGLPVGTYEITVLDLGTDHDVWEQTTTM